MALAAGASSHRALRFFSRLKKERVGKEGGPAADLALAAGLLFCFGPEICLLLAAPDHGPPGGVAGLAFIGGAEDAELLAAAKEASAHTARVRDLLDPGVRRVLDAMSRYLYDNMVRGP